MKTNVKKFIACLMAVIMVIGIAPVTVFATEIVESGQWGNNVYWTLDDNGILTFSGYGSMRNYYYDEEDYYSPFANNSQIKMVVIESGITDIGVGTFYGCSNITSVTIPNSVTSINYGAFYGCSSLSNVTIPDSVTAIGYNAFRGTALYNDNSNWENDILYIGKFLIKAKESITGDCEIKDGTKLIADEAFRYCKNLTGITISDSVATIGYESFLGCSNLKSAIIGNGVITIRGYAFEYCSNLTNVTVPNSVMNIDQGAFSQCSRLESVTIGNNVISIGRWAFGNTALYSNEDNWENDVLYISKYLIGAKTSISGNYTVKDGTRVIAGDAFRDCQGLTNITIPDGVLTIDEGAFLDCYRLESVTIPNSVITIGDSAFEDCSGLKSVTIPNSVNYIERWAFYNCNSLINVTIGDGVTTIGEEAFGYYYDYDIEDFAKIENFTIYGYTGTDAERYANENGFIFISLGLPHTHSYTAEVTKPATCTENGIRTYTCECGDSYTEEITATGHSYGDWSITKKATCTESGSKEKTCSKCNDVVAETIAKSEHTVVTDAAVTPTCTATGLTEGSHCSVCNTVLVAQQELPATGHTDSNDDGVCDNCGEILHQETPGLTFIQRIQNFFKRIFDLIRNLFK